VTEVHLGIVLADRGWILEHMAAELTRRLPYAEIVETPSTDLTYYLNYSAFQSRHAKAEVAFFTHIEDAPEARSRFFETARAVDACVCHSAPSQQALLSAGVANVQVIPPGVDLESFNVRVRVGIVGRTYHTGRKGEHLVAEAMDVPGIEWAFTGMGWPGRSEHVSSESLPAFYRSLDYLLVPSLEEAGPMSVVEALACGTPVIAPPVGWVPDYPHIEYRTGDVADLRRVLTEVVATKLRLRASVAGRSWDVWAEKHDMLFHTLARRLGLSPGPSATSVRTNILLRSHGSEAQSLGGPSVRIPILGKHLEQAGLRLISDGDRPPDITHIFNAWPQATAFEAIRAAKAFGSRVVFSPIFLDLSGQAVWEHRLLAGLKHSPTSQNAFACFAEVRSLRELARDSGCHSEPAPGYFASLRQMILLSDALILLSEAERRLLLSIGARLPPLTQIVPNAANVATRRFDPKVFEKQFGVADYVLCIGRLEPRKNQLALVLAMRELGIPLVLVGHSTHPEYRRLIEMHRWDGLTIIDRLDNNSPLFWSAIAGARVFALPSWAEGGPLAALEAAAAGCNLVLSDGFGEKEYFGKWATYVDPGDLLALRRAIQESLDTPRSKNDQQDQQQFFREHYSWDRHAKLTRDVYASVAQRKEPSGADSEVAVAPSSTSPLLLDVTTLANHTGRWTGVSRVEARIALNVKAVLGQRVSFVAWSDKTGAFVPISAASVHSGTVAHELITHDNFVSPRLQCSEGTRLLVVGSAWMQNAQYASGVGELVRRLNLRLTLVVHDCFPLRFPHWYEENYAPVFRENLLLMLSAACSVVAVSRTTATDLQAALGTGHAALSNLPIGVFREGDDIEAQSHTRVSEPVRASLRGVPFVLAVGAIHARKNYGLLHQVWLRLAREMHSDCPRLVIVGGVAWNGRETADAFTRDPRLDGFVQLLDKVDDATLTWLYRSALLTVYPSSAEGWGLPVAESLRLGTICLASDLPSICEIHDTLVERLDPLDPKIWATRIRFYVGSEAARLAAQERIRVGYKSHSWTDAAGSLITAVDDLAPRERQAVSDFGTYALGTLVQFGRYSGPGFLLGAGWQSPEVWGMAMKIARSAIAFRLDVAQTHPLLISVLLRVPDELKGSVVVVRSAGKPVARWLLTADRFVTRHAMLEAGSCAASLVDFQLEAVTGGLGVCCLALSSLSEVATVEAALGQPRSSPMFGEQVSGSAGRALIELHELPGRPTELEVVVSPKEIADGIDGASLIVNGTPLAAYCIDPERRTRLVVNMPALLRVANDPIVLDVVPHSSGGTRLTQESLNIHGVRDVSEQAVQRRAIACEIGEIMNLGSVPGISQRLGSAWQAVSGHGVRALAATVSLPLRLPAADGPLDLVLMLIGLFSNPEEQQELDVRIFVQGRLLQAVSLSHEEQRNVGVRIGSSMMDKGGFVELVISILPKDGRMTSGNLTILGLALNRASSDAPELDVKDVCSAGLHEAVLWHPAVGGSSMLPADGTPTPHTEQQGTLVDFTLAGDAPTSSRNGWFPPEVGGTWSEASRASVELPLPPDAAGVLKLTLEGRVYGTAWTGPARVVVLLDEGEQHEWDFPDDDYHYRSLTIYRPANGLSKLNLTMSRRGGIAPISTGTSNDGRVLGMLVKGVLIKREQP